MKKFIDLLTRYQITLIMVMLVLGLVFPRVFNVFSSHSTVLLQVIMFATGIRLDFSELFRELRDWKTMLLATSMKLVITPILISIPLALFAPEWSLPFLIAGAMPAGLTAPALVAVLGGRAPLALVVAVVTSALAPFTIPLILTALAGQSVHLNAPSMIWQTAQAVLMPLLLAGILQRLLGRERIARAETPIRAAGLFAFALILASITAGSAIAASYGGESLLSIGFDGLLIATLMLIFWTGIAWLASAVLSWRSPKDRATITFCLVYMNYTLALWVGNAFFREAEIAPKLIAIILILLALIPAFRFLFPKPKKAVGPVCLLDVHA